MVRPNIWTEMKPGPGGPHDFDIGRLEAAQDGAYQRRFRVGIITLYLWHVEAPKK